MACGSCWAPSAARRSSRRRRTTGRPWPASSPAWRRLRAECTRSTSSARTWSATRQAAQEAARQAEQGRKEAEAAREAEREERRRWIATYSGYQIIVRKGEQILALRRVGAKKAEAILEDDSELSVYLKGIASPFCWLNLDLVSAEAQACGLLVFDEAGKAWIIDVSKNPPKPGAEKEAAQRAEQARVAAETAQRAARTLELLEQLAATVPALRTALDGLWAEWQGTAPPAPSTNGQHTATTTA